MNSTGAGQGSGLMDPSGLKLTARREASAPLSEKPADAGPAKDASAPKAPSPAPPPQPKPKPIQHRGRDSLVDALEIAAASRVLETGHEGPIDAAQLLYGEAKTIFNGLDLARLNHALHTAAANFHNADDAAAIARALLKRHRFDGPAAAASIETMHEGVRSALLPSGFSAAPALAGAPSESKPRVEGRRYSADLSESERSELIADALKAMDDFLGMEEPKAFVRSFERKMRQERRRRVATIAAGRDQNN
ncbi:MAG: hypothetical protein AAF658_02490 [Myxococcota bacterium]